MCAYLPKFLPTYSYVHNFIRIVPIVPHPIFSGSQWSSFCYELKSVPVRFGPNWSPFRSVSVPKEVRFGIFVGPFRSVSVSRDTGSMSRWQNLEINANFHISHYKSMGTLSCHSNKMTQATVIKNTGYVRANVMNISKIYKISISSPLWLLRRRFFNIVFRKFSLSVAMTTNQNQRFGQNSYG